MLNDPSTLLLRVGARRAVWRGRRRIVLWLGASLFFIVQAALGEETRSQDARTSPRQQTGLPGVAGHAISGESPVFGELPSDVAPPLSIYESCLMLMETSRTLARKSPVAPEVIAGQVDRILRAVILYVERVDRAHPTLPFYRWQQISGEKVRTSNWGTRAFTIKNSIRRVTALSLQVHHGDVEIKYLAAIDKNKTKWEFNRTILVPNDQPRSEICFLPLPVRLAEVRITCRRMDPQAKRLPRLFIDAGICSIPESAKQANYYLQMARNDLKRAQLADASEHIQKAYKLLREYQSRL